jgi:peptide/nickel transport system substrate-binding protein
VTRNKMLFAVMIVLLIGAFPDFGQGAQAKDEVLKIAVGAEIATPDPSLYASGADLIVVENWGEWLLNKAPSGELTSGLVTSWKVSPDGKKMECTLRKGVKFHSGDLFTTKDVKFSFERGRTKNSSVKQDLQSVERLEIIDDYHFNFHFKQPDVQFITRRLGNIPIVSEDYHKRVGEETFSKQPSGTGPYKMVSYRPGEYVDIEGFEEYWGKKPPVKKARIYFVPEETTRVAKLMAGEVDLVQSVPFTALAEFRKSSNFKLLKLETNAPTSAIAFGSKNPKMPWYDKRVRLAVAHAIDCKSILHDILQDNAIHLPGVAPGEVGYDPELKAYPYDPKKAKALLAEAGYPNGFNMNLTFPIGGKVSMNNEIAQAIASYLEAVGIRTNLIGMEQAAMLADRKKAMDPNADYVAFYTANLAGVAEPTSSIDSFFTSKGVRAIFEHPEVTKINAVARSTMDNKTRGELIKKMVKILHEEVAYIPIITNVCTYALKKNIDFTPTKMINFDYVLVKDMAFK